MPAPDAHAQAISGPNGDQSSASGRDLYLEVTVNGVSANLIAAFREGLDGKLAIEAEQLRNVGIAPTSEARRSDGLIQIDLLRSVSFQYDELKQTIAFSAADEGRAARVINAADRQVADLDAAEISKPISSYGALLNYSVFASTQNDNANEKFSFKGISGSFEGRFFSPYGVFSQTFVASTSPSTLYDSTRLETSWAYSDTGSMTTYRLGDFITGGLTWTRPTRLGGFQMQRNFGLRSDLVTIPVPELAGSAAVASTVEVYLNNTRRFSEAVPAGPFEISNLPIVTGAGTARVVVRDAQGQEVVTESDFFASSKLLAPGLLDFSGEVGFARQFFGTESNVYNEQPLASGSLRYGLTNWLTLEGHAEGGQDLANGGGGIVFGIGAVGVASLSAASSYSHGSAGHQLAGFAELDFWGVRVYGRMQRTYGDYQDIASLTYEESTGAAMLRSADPPKALDQVSVSLPLVFDPSNLNLSFTQIQSAEGDRQRVLGLSYSRPVFGNSTISVSGFTDLNEDTHGVYAGLTIPLGKDHSSSSSVSSGADGDIRSTVDFSRAEGQQVGDYGWRVRHNEAEDATSSAAASYRTEFARLAGRLEQHDKHYGASASVEGAVVAAAGGVFAANRINDAFAVVDAGAPGIDVQHENRPAGRTNKNGKLLIPRLRSNEKNRLSIDPTNLPLDAVVNSTREIIIPADRSGVVVRFDVNADANAALVTFRYPDGRHVEMGATGRVGEEAGLFTIGYDGQALLEGLTPNNRIRVERADGSSCVVQLKYRAKQGKQVNIPDAICQPI